jgi:hypothetical protein
MMIFIHWEMTFLEQALFFAPHIASNGFWPSISSEKWRFAAIILAASRTALA